MAHMNIIGAELDNYQTLSCEKDSRETPHNWLGRAVNTVASTLPKKQLSGRNHFSKAGMQGLLITGGCTSP